MLCAHSKKYAHYAQKVICAYEAKRHQHMHPYNNNNGASTKVLCVPFMSMPLVQKVDVTLQSENKDDNRKRA